MADAAALLPIVTNETTMKYTSGLVANDLEVVKRWLSARALGNDVLNFIVTLKDDGPPEEGQVVGIMGSYHFPEIGYLMHPGMFCANSLMNLACVFDVFCLLVTTPLISSHANHHPNLQPMPAKATPPKRSALTSQHTSPTSLRPPQFQARWATTTCKLKQTQKTSPVSEFC